MEAVLISERKCDNGNIHIAYAIGYSNYKKNGEFWLPSTFTELSAERRSEILKKRIGEIQGWNQNPKKGTVVDIHLMGTTGVIK